MDAQKRAALEAAGLESRGCRRFPQADRGRATNHRIPADGRPGSPTAPGEPPSHAATTGRADRVEPVPGRQDRSGVERGFAGPDAPRLLLGRRPAVRLGPVSSASLRAETIAVVTQPGRGSLLMTRGSKPSAINVTRSWSRRPAFHREHCHRRFGRPGVRRRLRPTRQIHPGVSDRLDPPGNVFGEAFGHAITTGTYSKEEGRRDVTDIDRLRWERASRRCT